MSVYAFDDFCHIIRSMQPPISADNPKVRYACALISELAYHHVRQPEIDDKRRARLVPCEGYQQIVRKGVGTDVRSILLSTEFEQQFVIVGRGVVVVGVRVGNILIIAFRGTIMDSVRDWKISLNLRRSSFCSCRIWSLPYIFRCKSGGRFHQGFFKESLRISLRIKEEIERQSIKELSQVIFTGHSLGGAVAAISERLLSLRSSLTITFGAPRYCNDLAYLSHFPILPIQIRREGDVVPFVPFRWLGYSGPPTGIRHSWEDYQANRPRTASVVHILKNSVSFPVTGKGP